MEHGKPVNDNPTPRMALSIDQLPAIDVTAAFASSDDFDAIVMSAHEQGPFARSARGLEVLGHKECVVLLRDRRLYTDHMSLVEAMDFPEGMPILASFS